MFFKISVCVMVFIILFDIALLCAAAIDRLEDQEDDREEDDLK